MTIPPGAKAPRNDKNDEIRPLSDKHDDIPRLEPWLKGLLLAFIPLIAALFVPRPIGTPLLYLGCAVLLVSVGAFVLSEVRQARRR
jgi:hypothetical protein